MILFVPLFAFIFINIYLPFDFGRIGELLGTHIKISEKTLTLLAALIIVISGMAIGTISRLIMSAYTKHTTLTYLGYIVWILGEIVAMATLFTLFSLFTDNPEAITDTLRNSVVYTALIVFIPYTLSYIVFVLREKMHELKMLRQQIERDETVLQRAYIQILDEKGEMRLSIELGDDRVCRQLCLHSLFERPEDKEDNGSQHSKPCSRASARFAHRAMPPLLYDKPRPRAGASPRQGGHLYRGRNRGRSEHSDITHLCG